MRLNFKCRVAVVNNKTQFPDTTVTRVAVCMHDAYTSQVIDVVGGSFHVDFELEPNGHYSEAVSMNDALKFHFYACMPPSRLAAGWVDLPVLLGKLAGGEVHHDEILCNFTTHRFLLQFSTDDIPCMQAALDKWHNSTTVPSCLRDSAVMVQHFQNICQQVTGSLRTKVVVNPDNGGTMFCNLGTAHTMQGEMTLHSQFQSDMAPDIHDATLLHFSGLTMLAVANTLQLHGLTCEEARTKLPAFMASACQFAQTSAHLMPYQSDVGLDASLDVMGQAKFVLSEDFKRPFTEPFLYTDGVVQPIFTDDCEGMSTEILFVYSSFKFLWTTYGAEWRSLNSSNAFAQIRDRDKLSGFLDRFFPSFLFNMSTENKAKVCDLAMAMGKAAQDGVVDCSLALVTASAQALGDSDSQKLGGHCCVVFTDNTNMDAPMSILAEGTNCMTMDRNSTVLAVKTPTGVKQMPFSDIANQITMFLAKGEDQTDERVCMHLTGLVGQPLPFYKTLFCQNDSLMATSQGESLHYGLDVCRLCDENSKVFMPITLEHIPELVQHCQARKSEIHAPRVSVEKLRAALSACSPVSMFTEIPELKGRTYTNCMLAHSARTLDERRELFMKAQAQAEAFNNSDRINVGFMRVYESMDSVYTVLSAWTDKTDCIKTLVQNSIAHMSQIHQERQN